ncbi:Uncharacterized protein Adt_20854 [Abeliophyllum distichum]|uniref:Uncharacterized protein n=1 Tax=Abeliophyllum distichum TaxID=126358 RepID=A0ABD1SY02_9LAMI
MLQHVDHHLMHALPKEDIVGSRASPTGTRPPCRLILQWSNASLKGLSHWDSATLQHAPPMEQRLAQGPFPLGLDHLAACFSDGTTLHSRASLTRTRPPYILLLLWSNAWLKGLFHWDSTTLKLTHPMEQRFAHGPLPLGLGHLVACSSDGATLRSRASPTGT